MPRETEETFDVDGQIVRCVELDGDRLWHCQCARFLERLSSFQEGFSGHIAVAMMEHLTKSSDLG